jgi:hypothetical protein
LKIILTKNWLERVQNKWTSEWNMKQSKVESRQAANSPDLGFWITPHHSPQASSASLSSSFLLASASSAFLTFFLDSMFAPAGVLGAEYNQVLWPTTRNSSSSSNAHDPFTLTDPDTAVAALHPSYISAMAGCGGSSEVWGGEGSTGIEAAL